MVLVNGRIKGWPASPRLKLCVRGEEWQASNGTYIRALFLAVVGHAIDRLSQQKGDCNVSPVMGDSACRS